MEYDCQGKPCAQSKLKRTEAGAAEDGAGVAEGVWAESHTAGRNARSRHHRFILMGDSISAKRLVAAATWRRCADDRSRWRERRRRRRVRAAQASPVNAPP